MGGWAYCSGFGLKWYLTGSRVAVRTVRHVSFLRKGLEFDTQPSILGIATNYHDDLCYHYGGKSFSLLNTPLPLPPPYLPYYGLQGKVR